jgi:hypothetical protein
MLRLMHPGLHVPNAADMPRIHIDVVMVCQA